MIKTDLKRDLKHLYAAGREPRLVTVPRLPFLMVDGRGEPEASRDFQEAVQALYSVSYAVKFAVRRLGEIDPTVMPLEGRWRPSSSEGFSWDWTLMIAQPLQVTRELVLDATADAWRKHELATLWQLRLEEFEEGLCAQVLHVGPYAEEAATIARLDAFISSNGYARRGDHHEIYLGDPRRAAPDRLKTILRVAIKEG